MSNKEIKEVFEFLYLNEQQLSLTQISFIKSLKKYYGRNKTLSERQRKVLFEIRKYIEIE